MLSRRHFAKNVLGGALLFYSSSCDSNSTAQKKILDKDDLFASSYFQIRHTPINIPLNPLPSKVMTDSEELAVAKVVTPNPLLKKYPLSYVFHALRLWGTRAFFPDLNFVNLAVTSKVGQDFLTSLTNHSAYIRLIQFELSELLVPGKFGVAVRSNADAVWGQKYAQAHIGNYIHVCAECGVQSDLPLTLAPSHKSQSYILADIIIEEAKQLHHSQELEWVLTGLMRYLKINSWSNRFGQVVTFDLLVSKLLLKEVSKSACDGGHIPYALVTALAVDDQVNCLSSKVRESLIKRIREMSDLLELLQRGNGAWPKKWTETDHPEEESSSPRSLWGTEFVDMVAITGHHLEWIAICPEDLRPSNSTIERAGQFLINSIPLLQSLVTEDWHAYYPLTHAARGLFMIQGKQYPNWITINNNTKE